MVGENVQLVCTRYEEKEAHPTQEAFNVDFAMPWQRKPYGAVKIEITFDEPVLFTPAPRPLLVTYGDVEADILSYALEEVITEKLRAAPQTVANREKRIAQGKGGWLKPRGRDYYDLWQIVNAPGSVDWDAVARKLAEKCAVRGVSIASARDVFATEITDGVKRNWKGQLEDFVPAPLPDVEDLLAKLEPALASRLGWK